MSIMRYISFPRELIKHQVSYIKFDDEDGFRIDTDAKEDWDKDLPVIKGRIDGRFSIWDIIGRAVFKNCFKNPFIYEFHAEAPDYYYKQRMDIVRKHMGRKAIDRCLDDKAMNQELYVYWNKGQSLQNQVLYKYLYDNLNVGEFVEIYKSWIEKEDERGIIFSPPTSETVINLDELLNLPYPMETLKDGEREKLTIHKTD